MFGTTNPIGVGKPCRLRTYLNLCAFSLLETERWKFFIFSCSFVVVYRALKVYVSLMISILILCAGYLTYETTDLMGQHKLCN